MYNRRTKVANIKFSRYTYFRGGVVAINDYHVLLMLAMCSISNSDSQDSCISVCCLVSY